MILSALETEWNKLHHPNLNFLAANNRFFIPIGDFYRNLSWDGATKDQDHVPGEKSHKLATVSWIVRVIG